MRVRGLLLAATAVVTLAASGAVGQTRTSAAPRNRILLTLPKPGHVTVAALKLVAKTVPGRAPQKLKLQYFGGGRGAVLLAAMTTKRARAQTTYRLLLVLLNPVRRSTRSLSSSLRAADRPIQFNDPNGLLLFAVIVSGQSEYDLGTGVYASSAGLPGSAHFNDGYSFVDAPNVDLSPSGRVSKEIRGDSPNGLDSSLDTGHYDDGHSFGWKTHKGPEEWVGKTYEVASLPPSAPRPVVQGTVDQLYRDAGLEAPSAARCLAASSGCNYKFSFTGPLHMDWQWPVNPHNNNQRDSQAFDVLRGTGCGTDAAHAVWTIVEQTSGLSPQSLLVDLVHGTTTNPAKITDAEYGGSPAADVQIYLRFTGGAQPQVTLLAQPHGDVVGPNINPGTAAVTKTPVKTC